MPEPEPLPGARDPAVRIHRLPAVAMVTLRGDLADPGLAAAVRAETGSALPDTRRYVAGATGAVAWMSPDELMLFLAPGAAPAAVDRLAAALAGLPHLAADVSDARAIFRLEGPGARAVLAKGAPVDLAAFAPGDFRRTRLGQVAAAIWMPEPDMLELMVFRSVAGFVAGWLATASLPGSLAGLLTPPPASVDS